MEAGATGSYRSPFDADSGYSVVRGRSALGWRPGRCRPGRNCLARYLRAEGSIGGVRPIIGTQSQVHLRLYGGIAQQRARAAGRVRVEPGSIRDL